MPNKPNIVLVHGFWGGAAHWGKVIVGLILGLFGLMILMLILALVLGGS